MSQNNQGSASKHRTPHQLANIVSEAMKTQQQLRTLLEMGEMDKEEAEHGISNAEQVILFAQAAMKREEN